MTSDQIQELIQYLINTGETMATGAYQLALQRTVFLGIQSLLAAVLSIIALVVFVRMVRKGRKIDEKRKSYSDDDGFIYIMLGWVFGVMSVATGFYFIGNAIDLFLNPEWNAIKMILSFGQ